MQLDQLKRRDFITLLGDPDARVSWPAQIEALKAAGCERVYSERASPGADSRSLPRARARRGVPFFSRTLS